MGELLEHAKRELLLVGYTLNDEEPRKEDRMMSDCLLSLVGHFESQGHSVVSESYCLAVFRRLARHEPLTKLTGADNEWREMGDGIFQNKRYPLVFKSEEPFNGKAYLVRSQLFRSPDGHIKIVPDGPFPITFPYAPDLDSPPKVTDLSEEEWQEVEKKFG